MKLSNKGGDNTQFIVTGKSVTPGDYKYGFGQPQLPPEAVRLSSGGGSVYMNGFTFNATGNRSITGVGFTPLQVSFTYHDTSNTGFGNGAMTATYQFGFDGNSKTSINQCIYIRNSGGTAIGRAVFVSMDSDGFTINVTLASTTIQVYFTAIG